MTTPVALLTFSTNENVPVFVGVPKIAPAASRKSPGGNPDVEKTDHVAGPLLSNATRAREYGLPTEASGKVVVNTVALTTVIVIVRVPMFGVGAESWARSLTTYTPGDGIAPVSAIWPAAGPPTNGSLPFARITPGGRSDSAVTV